LVGVAVAVLFAVAVAVLFAVAVAVLFGVALGVGVAQTLAAQTWPAPHASPHAPQLETSVWRFASQPSATSWSQSA
jgi:hypothetical protein